MRFFRFLLLPLTVLALASCRKAPGHEPIRIGCKNFTEQFILGEILAQTIEAKTELTVDRRFNLGGTMVCHGAMENGDLDLYPEYTGTGLVTVLKRAVIADPDAAYAAVKAGYEEQSAGTWLRPFGFNNTYAITVRADAAAEHGWQTVSDLVADAAALTAGFTGEFMERADGYPGLKAAYDIEFGSTRDLDPGLMYQAIHQGKVDVICAFATDGRIAAYDLKPLTDDKGFFPPYYAAPVIRSDVLAAHPELRDVLDQLGNRLDDAAMQRLNLAVDEDKKDPADVAAAWLAEAGIVER